MATYGSSKRFKPALQFSPSRKALYGENPRVVPDRLKSSKTSPTTKMEGLERAFKTFLHGYEQRMGMSEQDKLNQLYYKEYGEEASPTLSLIDALFAGETAGESLGSGNYYDKPVYAQDPRDFIDEKLWTIERDKPAPLDEEPFENYSPSPIEGTGATEERGGITDTLNLFPEYKQRSEEPPADTGDNAYGSVINSPASGGNLNQGIAPYADLGPERPVLESVGPVYAQASTPIITDPLISALAEGSPASGPNWYRMKGAVDQSVEEGAGDPLQGALIGPEEDSDLSRLDQILGFKAYTPEGMGLKQEMLGRIDAEARGIDQYPGRPTAPLQNLNRLVELRKTLQRTDLTPEERDEAEYALLTLTQMINRDPETVGILAASKAYYGTAGKSGAETHSEEHAGAKKSLGLYNENIGLLKELDEYAEKGILPTTGILYEFRSNVLKARNWFQNNVTAEQQVELNNMLDVRMGSQVFPLIHALGIGARGMDTPEEREFMLRVLSGSRSLDINTIKYMADLRLQTARKTIEYFNERQQRGIYEPYFNSIREPNAPIKVPWDTDETSLAKQVTSKLLNSQNETPTDDPYSYDKLTDAQKEAVESEEVWDMMDVAGQTSFFK